MATLEDKFTMRSAIVDEPSEHQLA